MTYLLTWHGTLLARSRTTGALSQLPLAAPAAQFDLEPLRIGLDWHALRADFASFLTPATTASCVELAAGDLPGMTATISADRRTLTLSRDGLFLCAERHRNSVLLDRTSAHAWETFLPLTDEDVAALGHILGNNWVLHQSRRLVPRAEIRLHTGFQLRLGEIMLDLRYHLPFDAGDLPFRLRLLRDGWKLDQAHLFRPLIYYSALGSPLILEQMSLSVRSLVILGRYDGHVHVLTDGDFVDVARHTMPLDPARLTVQRVVAGDRVSRTAAKFAILEWPEAASFQPIMFFDADTIVNADIERLLVAVALSCRIVAPRETFSPLRTAPSAGAEMFGQDGVDPGPGHGFNSGTLGIANLVLHGANLRLVRKVIVNRDALLGRRHFSWVDQPVMNYVLHRLDAIDTALISGFVRHGYAGVELDGTNRTGLVHFWPPRDQRRKRDAMRVYLHTLGVDPGAPLHP